MDPVEGLCVWVWDENCIYEFTVSEWQNRTIATIPVGNWIVFFCNGSGMITYLALDNDGTLLRVRGAAATPEFSVGILRLSSTSGVDLNQTAFKTTLFTVHICRTFVTTLVMVSLPAATVANVTAGFDGDANMLPTGRLESHFRA